MPKYIKIDAKSRPNWAGAGFEPRYTTAGFRSAQPAARPMDSKSRILKVGKRGNHKQLILFNFFKLFLVSFGTNWKNLTLTGTIWAQFKLLQPKI